MSPRNALGTLIRLGSLQVPNGASFTGGTRMYFQKRCPGGGNLDLPKHEPSPGDEGVSWAARPAAYPWCATTGKLMKSMERKRDRLLRSSSAPEASPGEVLEGPTDLRFHRVSISFSRHRIGRQVPGRRAISPVPQRRCDQDDLLGGDRVEPEAARPECPLHRLELGDEGSARANRVHVVQDVADCPRPCCRAL